MFPEDFNGRYDKEPRGHLATMDFAIQVLDEILADALAFIDRNPRLIVVLATSMGQGPIEYGWHEGYEASVADPSALVATFSVDREHYSHLLAMAPQAAVQVPDESQRQALRVSLESVRTVSGERLFVVIEIGVSLSITVLTPKIDDIKAGGFRKKAGGAFVTWADAGLSMNQVEPGTAYHIPEGILAVVGDGIDAQDSRENLPADHVKNVILKLAGLHVQS